MQIGLPVAARGLCLLMVSAEETPEAADGHLQLILPR